MATPNKPIPKEPVVIACNTCLAEIPQSVASNQEADEYAQHYCGLECYLEWKQRNPEDKEK